MDKVLWIYVSKQWHVIVKMNLPPRGHVLLPLPHDDLRRPPPHLRTASNGHFHQVHVLPHFLLSMISCRKSKVTIIANIWAKIWASPMGKKWVSLNEKYNGSFAFMSILLLHHRRELQAWLPHILKSIRNNRRPPRHTSLMACQLGTLTRSDARSPSGGNVDYNPFLIAGLLFLRLDWEAN